MFGLSANVFGKVTSLDSRSVTGICEDVSGSGLELIRYPRKGAAEIKNFAVIEAPKVVERGVFFLPDRFKRFTGTHVLPGKTEEGCVYLCSGLAATVKPMLPLAYNISKRHETQCVVSALDRHDSWANFTRFSAGPAIEVMTRQALRLRELSGGIPPVCIAFSTSALVAAIAQGRYRRNKGEQLFSRIIMIGAPFRVLEMLSFDQAQMTQSIKRSPDAGLKLATVVVPLLKPLLNLWPGGKAWKIFSVAMALDDLNQRCPSGRVQEQLRKNPLIARIPYSVAATLHKLMRMARRELAYVDCPVRIAQGELDQVIHANVPYFVGRYCNTSDFASIVVPGAVHAAMLDPDGKSILFKEIMRWLAEAKQSKGTLVA